MHQKCTGTKILVFFVVYIPLLTGFIHKGSSFCYVFHKYLKRKVFSMAKQFKDYLNEGQKVEEAVVDQLTRLLPGYKIVHTPQDNDLDRYIYSLIDVVVMKGDRILFGIECKYGEQKYQRCLQKNGWDGDYNTPLNRSSLHKYKEAGYPVYLININRWCHKVFVADLPTILKSPNDAGKNVKVSGEVIYNVDSRTWMTYEGKINLSSIIKDIIKKEL